MPQAEPTHTEAVEAILTDEARSMHHDVELIDSAFVGVDPTVHIVLYRSRITPEEGGQAHVTTRLTIRGGDANASLTVRQDWENPSHG